MSGPFSLLLEVQDHDTVIDQLLHRKEHLPEKVELAQVSATLATLGLAITEAKARRDEVADRQAAVERELAASETRIGEIDKRMFSGDITASRELQAMQGEIDSLKERVSHLEDRALEAMEEREPLDTEVDRMLGQAGVLEEQAARLRSAIAAAEAEIDNGLSVERATRATVAEGLPPDLAAHYERLRARLGGVGAARLEHGTCMGCHLKLPATEVDRLKRLEPDSLVFCDQCGRILVRE